MGKGELRIRTFGDAVSAVFGLHDRFGHAHTAVALDEDGLVLDLRLASWGPDGLPTSRRPEPA